MVEVERWTPFVGLSGLLGQSRVCLLALIILCHSRNSLFR